jgi:hypothetical protein
MKKLDKTQKTLAKRTSRIKRGDYSLPILLILGAFLIFVKFFESHSFNLKKIYSNNFPEIGNCVSRCDGAKKLTEKKGYSDEKT